MSIIVPTRQTLQALQPSPTDQALQLVKDTMNLSPNPLYGNIDKSNPNAVQGTSDPWSGSASNNKYLLNQGSDDEPPISKEHLNDLEESMSHMRESTNIEDRRKEALEDQFEHTLAFYKTITNYKRDRAEDKAKLDATLKQMDEVLERSKAARKGNSN